MMIGSNNPYIIFVPTDKHGRLDVDTAIEYAASHPEVKGTPDNRHAAVCSCCVCNAQFWGLITSCTCSPACRAERQRQITAKNKANKQKIPNWLKAEEVILSDKMQQLLDEEDLQLEVEALNTSVLAWNEKNCCPLYGCHSGLACFYCKKGINYLTGKEDTSGRSCPDHPVAGDGSKYKYRKPFYLDEQGNKHGGEIVELNTSTEESVR